MFFEPNFLGHSDNFIEANPMSTPAHIVPEWYFLPFYAILRSVPDKLLGVLAMAASIMIFFLFPVFAHIHDRYCPFFKQGQIFYNKWVHPLFSIIFFTIFVLLGWIGSQPVEYPYLEFGSILVQVYFIFIIVAFFVFPFIYDLYVKLVYGTELNKINEEE